MKTSFRIATLLDIPIKIHFTFIFILALFAWLFSIQTVTIYGFTIGFGDYPIALGLKILFGILVAIFLFACVLLHELGHSYVTQKFGHKINSITLFIFGGSSESEEIPKDPSKEFRIALSGPLVSIILGLTFYLIYSTINPLDFGVYFDVLSTMFGTLSFYNLILAGFNLIPAFPIDGGRLLRAAFAMRMEYQKATKTASNIGKGVAIAMAIFGIFFNIWLVLIAIFIFFGASQEQKATEISHALEGKQVHDIMRRDIESVSPDSTLRDVYNSMEKNKQFTYPVIAENEIVGIITIQDLQNIERNNWGEIHVKDVMNENVSTVSLDEDTFSVFKKIMKGNIERLFVKDNNELVGMISRNDFIKAIRFYGIDNR
ncbi:MAG: site-2 protease family protein [Candidatus Thermoplasmatota archaeon]|nr:site-2 protease family protein [Candidatus Thermoplasmatota archaeon]